MNALRPYLKAILPAVGTVIAVLIQWGATGEFDRAELVTALTGLTSALVTYAVPNRPALPEYASATPTGTTHRTTL